MSRTVTATTQFEGLHHWPDAPPRRAYLRAPHRHQFVVSATVLVEHDGRDVEFHDLADDVRQILFRISTSYHPEALIRDFGTRSCESIALDVALELDKQGYTVEQVTVSEDGENESTWRQEPKE